MKNLLILILFCSLTALAQIPPATLQWMEMAGTPRSASGSKTFSLVQWKTGIYSGNTSTLTNSCAAGDTLLVVLLTQYGISISDGGDKFTIITNFANYTGSYIQAYIATNITAGSKTVSTSSNASTCILELSSVSTNGWGSVVYGANPMQASVTTSQTCIFVGFWGDRYNNSATTCTLSPGNVSGQLIGYDSSGYAKTFVWLNGGAGYSAGSYTASLANSSRISSGWMLIALQ